jgi:hypothetical protein
MTASDIGRASRRKGVQAERELAKYLRTWWPGAERSVATGWRTRGRSLADTGDIRGTPGLAWQLKYRAAMSRAEIEVAMGDAETQAVAGGADYGFLVQRRPGKSDPGRWWAWLRVGDLCALATQQDKVYAPTVHAPVRVELADLVGLLRTASYGEGP